MIYTNEWAFIHIPRTSGINLKINLIKNNSDVRSLFNYNDDIFKDLSLEERVLQHNPYWWWQRQGILKDQQAFTIVRNPYYRAASMYNLVTTRHANYFSDISFEEFFTVDWSSDSRWLTDMKEVMWRYNTPQVEFIKSDNTRICKIYKYETDLKELGNYLNVDITSTTYNNSSEFDIQEFYEEDATRIKVVNEIFYEDFKIFDYEILDDK